MPAPADFSPEQFTDIVRRKARRMCRQADLNRSDLSDVEQQLYMKLLKAASKFDPSVGSPVAFAQTVISREAVNFFRDKRAERRNPARSVSLSVRIRVDDGEAAELAETLDETDRRRRHGSVQRAEHDLAQLAHDVDLALEELEPTLRSFAEALMATGNISEAARRMGLSRTGAYSQILRLRSRLGQKELQEYLRK